MSEKGAYYVLERYQRENKVFVMCWYIWEDVGALHITGFLLVSTPVIIHAYR